MPVSSVVGGGVPVSLVLFLVSGPEQPSIIANNSEVLDWQYEDQHAGTAPEGPLEEQRPGV